MSRQYWEEARDNGQRAVNYANSMLGVPVDDTTPLEILGERPATSTDRHMLYETDFNALVALEVKRGTVASDVGETAMSNFHIYMSGNRTPAPQTSPTFFQ